MADARLKHLEKEVKALRIKMKAVMQVCGMLSVAAFHDLGMDGHKTVCATIDEAAREAAEVFNG